MRRVKRRIIPAFTSAYLANSLDFDAPPRTSTALELEANAMMRDFVARSSYLFLGKLILIIRLFL